MVLDDGSKIKLRCQGDRLYDKGPLGALSYHKRGHFLPVNPVHGGRGDPLLFFVMMLWNCARKVVGSERFGEGSPMFFVVLCDDVVRELFARSVSRESQGTIIRGTI